MKAPMWPLIYLPSICPEPGCNTYLQRPLDESAGVEPHYTYCHPGIRAPKVRYHGD